MTSFDTNPTDAIEHPTVDTWTRIERLIADLRHRGMGISITEVVDAASACVHVDIARRDELRMALATTLVKRSQDLTTFAEVFDRHFPRRIAHPDAAGHGSFGEATADDLDDAIGDVVVADALIDAGLLVSEVVDRYSGIDEQARSERYHLYRTLRAVDLARILSEAIKRSLDGDVDVDRADLAARVEELRSMIAAEIRDRLAAEALGGLDTVDGVGRVADPFDVEMARARAEDLEHIRAAIRPLARRLASQLRRRRQSVGAGRIDIRRTIHRSRRTGGVPIDVVTRRPRARRPELFVLCDVSGSVADFSSFTLSLISGLAEELTSTRTFAFVDAIDEITDLFESAADAIEPWKILQSGRVIGQDGHSDYGTVLQSFWERYGRTGLSERSTVIIIGDARGNHRPARAEVVGRISARSRRVYWLNPEPRSDWDTADSTQSAYGVHCSAVYEVRTLRQLSEAVLQML